MYRFIRLMILSECCEVMLALKAIVYLDACCTFTLVNLQLFRDEDIYFVEETTDK